MKPRNTYSKEIRTGTLDKIAPLLHKVLAVLWNSGRSVICNPAALNLNPDSAVHDYRAGHGSLWSNGSQLSPLQSGCENICKLEVEAPSTLPGTAFGKEAGISQFCIQETSFSQVIKVLASFL